MTTTENPTTDTSQEEEAWPADVPRHQDENWFRLQDNPKAQRRAELRIAACWVVTALCGIGLMVLYVLGGQPQLEGTLLFFAFGGLGAGLAMWARDLMPGVDITAPREHHQSSEEDKLGFIQSLERGVGPMTRRPFLLKVLVPAGGLLGLAFLFPLASLGPTPKNRFRQTAWGAGGGPKRMLTDDGRAIKISDLDVNSIVTVFPPRRPNIDDSEHEDDNAAAQTVVINVGNGDFEIKPNREGWTPIQNGDRYVAFSKVCTHAGCPVGLYNRESQQLVCPCHQSTFDVLKACKPVFGPAPRSLPQLHISVDDEGYLVAEEDYKEPIGPGFWNR